MIPTVVLGRDKFIEYHTSLDNIDLINWDQYNETLNILKKGIEYIEKNGIII